MPGSVSARRIDDDGRECSLCTEYKDWEEFAPSLGGVHGRQSACRDCRRVRYESYHKPDAHRALLFKRLGITQDDYDFMLALFSGNCHLHDGPETRTDYRSGRLWWLSVDHDHSCCPQLRACRKCIRGLLCADCNVMLGLAEKTGVAAQYFTSYLGRRPLLTGGGDAL